MAPEGGYQTPDGQARGDERQRQISEIPSTSGLNGALMGAMPTGDRRAVLADWSIGAFLLYETDHPVVASGYHRNLAGIHDAYRVFVARIPEDVEQLGAILHERGVRWIVTRYDPQLFVRGSRSFPELG